MFQTLVSLCRKWYKLVGKTCIPVCTMITKPGLQPVKIPDAPHNYWEKSRWKNARTGLLHTHTENTRKFQPEENLRKTKFVLPEISVMIRFNLDFLSFSPDPVPVPLPICLLDMVSGQTKKIVICCLAQKKNDVFL